MKRSRGGWVVEAQNRQTTFPAAVWLLLANQLDMGGRPATRCAYLSLFFLARFPSILGFDISNYRVRPSAPSFPWLTMHMPVCLPASNPTHTSLTNRTFFSA